MGTRAGDWDVSRNIRVEVVHTVEILTVPGFSVVAVVKVRIAGIPSYFLFGIAGSGLH